MDWFRMYGDMPNDPKVGTLSDAEFRTWVELLCMACKAEKAGGTGLTMKTINWALRRNVTETLQKLVDANLVCFGDEDEIVIVAWEKRQYASDSSTGRVKRYRERQKNQAVTDGAEAAKDETLPKRSSNGLEQNRTDTEQNREKRGAIALATYLADCKEKDAKPIPEDDPVFAYADEVGIPHDFLRLHWVLFRDAYLKKGAKRYKCWPQHFRNSVEGNWYRVWAIKADGSYYLTTVGEQARRAHREAA